MPLYPLAVEVTPAGSDTQIQYNNAGAFGASAKLTWNDGSTRLTLGAPGAVLANIVTSPGDAGNINAVSFQFAAASGFNNGTDPAAGGNASFYGGDGVNGGAGGSVNFGAGLTDTGTPGSIEFTGGVADTQGNGGNISMFSGDGVGTNASGGNINLTLGVATGSGTPGQLIITNLPTSDPGISGALWVDGSNFLKVSP